jgi:hypothetical protein
MMEALMSDRLVPKRSTLLAQLQSRLAPAGVRRATGMPMLVREEGGRKEIFWLIYTLNPASADVAATVGVAFESIEKLMVEASGLYDNPGDYTMSVAEDAWRIDPAYQMTVRSAEDAPAAIDMLVRTWDNFALPFYARFRTVRDVAEYLTPQTVEKGNMPINCSVGVIAKRQSGSADYAQFVEFCRNRLAPLSNGFYLQRLDRLLARLS